MAGLYVRPAAEPQVARRHGRRVAGDATCGPSGTETKPQPISTSCTSPLPWRWARPASSRATGDKPPLARAARLSATLLSSAR